MIWVSVIIIISGSKIYDGDDNTVDDLIMITVILTTRLSQ